MSNLATLAWYLNHEERARRWTAVATACGLANVRVGRVLWFARHLEADAGLLRVVLTSDSSQDTNGGGSVLVTGVAAALSTSATVDPRDPLPPVGGPPLLRAALFDAVTRRLVTGLFASRIERDDGHVEEFPCSVRLDIGVLWVTHHRPLSKDALAAVLEVARRLRPQDALEPAVAALLRTETDARCRLYALRALVEQAPDHPATSEAARGFLQDPAPEMRLQAALALGDAGRDALGELAASPDVPDHVSARALGALGASLASDALTGVLRSASARRRPLSAIACIGLLTERGPGAVPPLVEAVASAHVGVARAAAAALGRIGASAAVVVALREMEARHASDRAVRSAARAAVAAVQARLQGAEAGQLSVAGAETGTVALADDPQGRIALEPDAPQS